ncbi:glucose-6-phosphate isomerase [Terrarubrum flagellatum]|uniref:glucose-6-phosphate isomerase n=1 Tax=Terrirubrum flagellatum TaxID=2895980 RepID=UPI003144F875
MSIEQSIDATRASKIGKGGLSEACIATAFHDVGAAAEKLRGQIRDGSLPLMALPDDTHDLAEIRDLAEEIVDGAKDVVVLGVGGSALGAKTLAQLADHDVPGLAPRNGLRVHFMDNLDPLTFGRVIDTLPMKTTRFISISKSGGTGETLMQTCVAIAALEKADLGKRIAKHLFAITEPEKPGKTNALRALTAPFGVTTLEHHTGVGGRYSVLTNVGLLPAAVMGLKIAAIRKGARAALTSLARHDTSKAPAVAGAVVNLAAMREGKNISVMMGYGDRFEKLARWWVQLWAESLGKDGQGSQPVAALGPVDQHSQQQLYLAGPRDKLFTVLTLDVKDTGPKIAKPLAKLCNEPDFGGKRIGDLVAAQGRAMIDTFIRNGRPVRHIHLGKLDEETLGELLMTLMIETILTGYAMGVDPFDQPAVEEAKILAKKYLAEG